MLRRYFGYAVFLVLALAVQPARAVPFSWSLGEIPFGPFEPNETVVLTAHINNTSANTVYFCNCIGNQDTYSFGAVASITGPTSSYSFQWGDGSVPGSFAPPASVASGESSSFVVAKYVPNGPRPEGLYPFSVTLQLFQATADRPMVGQSGFGGNWQVVAVPEPSSVMLVLVGSGVTLTLGGFLRRRL